jgi:hypothetical protein
VQYSARCLALSVFLAEARADFSDDPSKLLIARTELDQSCLAVAARNGFARVVRKCLCIMPLMAGDSPQVGPLQGWTCLHAAVDRFQSCRTDEARAAILATIEVLLPYMTAEDLNRRTDATGSSIMHLAVGAGKPDVVRTLLDYSRKNDKVISVNLVDSRGRTPLDLCVYNSNSACRKLLTAHGATRSSHIVDDRPAKRRRCT